MTEDQIVFDVGGTLYRTTRQTISRHPDCMLAKLLENNWTETHNQSIFIDRNGRPFEFVLDYLRNDVCTVLPNDATLLEQVRFESLYYNLPGLLKLCEEKSLSLSQKHIDQSKGALIGESVSWVEGVAYTLLNSSLCEFYGLSTEFSVTCLDCDKTIYLFHVLDGAVIEDINRTYPSFVANQKSEKLLQLICSWRGIVTRQRQDGCLQVDWGEEVGRSFHVPQSALKLICTTKA